MLASARFPTRLLLILAALNWIDISRANSLTFRPPEWLLENPPRAGQPFRTRFLDRDIVFSGYDRHSINAWIIGTTINFPSPSGRPAEPLASLYLWRRPDRDHLFYADIALVYNHLFYAQSIEPGSPWEWVTTFENYSIPWLHQSELIEGRDDSASEVEWGYVRAGFGLGYRMPVSPFQVDNMAALDLIIEPGLLYFGDHDKAFTPPGDTFELRTRLQLRWDSLSRNLLNLADRGFAFGADGIWGHRTHWDDWGVNQTEKGRDNYYLGSAYALVATNLPFASARHRLIASVNGGIGHHLDRFNRTITQRLGGGINPLGQEFHTTGYPILPGAAYLEFFPDHYVIGYGEYRFAPTFFSFVHFYGGGAYLNPRRVKHGQASRENTVMPFVGARISTGLPGKLLLVVDYAHNFGLKRRGTGYGNQVTVWVSGMF